MSNNLVLHFSLPNRQVIPMEHVSTSRDLPTSEMNMRMVGQVPISDQSHHFALSNEQIGVSEPMSNDHGYHNVLVPKNQVGQNEQDVGSDGSSSFWMPGDQRHGGAVNRNTQAGENSLLPSKRKAEGGPEQLHFVPQQSLMPNKHPMHLGANISSPGLTQLGKKTAPKQSKLSSPGMHNQLLLNKKMVRSESIFSKSGGPRGQNSKRQTSLIESGSKSQMESSEAVRSKMRESMADALSLAFEKQNKDENSEKKNTDTANTNQTPVECLSSGSNLTSTIPISGSEDISPSTELATAAMPIGSRALPAEFPTHESSGSGAQAFGDFHYTTILADEDVSFSENFFVNDDLLQGNGLSWALDFDPEVREGNEAHNSEKAKSMEEPHGAGDRDELASLTPNTLAFRIEAELFKVFGGVNKKYKEKGRSLLFNLKDRNNPELRERVASGEISPERLCSMSAEDLASKELSEWRMAKAEEMAQMVVLPDTDIKRLVKKTHKGEYQVEVERDYGMASEVSGGTTVLTQLKPKETQTHSPSKSDDTKDTENVAGQEKNSESQGFADSLVIPADGTDLMQGMMADDELRDADFLPPIVSLDEFMESLNSEPPFENLPKDADERIPVLGQKSPEVKSSKSSTSGTVSGDSKRTSSKKTGDSVSEKKVDVAVQSNRSAAVQKGLPFSNASQVECLWEGTLQLNISSSVTVGGKLLSGEKTSTKEWPSSLEIKGRVRLDAFEKFFRELPMSRTRAVMILHFVLKNKESENEKTAISEAVDSYGAEDRLGFAEPAPGVELYLCPPSQKIINVLSEHHNKMPNTIDDGLIGVVVWRRRHISNTISPNSSSHHKNSSKKQPFAHLKEGQNSNNNNTTLASANTPTTPRPNPKPQENEDDDIPPGFGPVAAARAARDDDDLPEFNFSSQVKPSVGPGVSSQNLNRGVKMTTTLNQNPQLPVDQVRQLIQKYGQNETGATNRNWVENKGLGIEPWKDDDDDDDIPEWRPNAPPPVHHHLQPPPHGFRPPMQRPLANQHVIPPVGQQLPQPLANPSGLVSWPPGARWAPPPGHHQGPRWRQ